MAVRFDNLIIVQISILCNISSLSCTLGTIQMCSAQSTNFSDLGTGLIDVNRSFFLYVIIH